MKEIDIQIKELDIKEIVKILTNKLKTLSEEIKENNKNAEINLELIIINKVNIYARLLNAEEQDILSVKIQKILEECITDDMEIEFKISEESEDLGIDKIKEVFESDVEICDTKFIDRSIRSGIKEEYIGSVVIMGDVNPGAEVVAGGNIMILGTLRGLAHAGANGNIKAVVAANATAKTQIRIADKLKVLEEYNKCPIFYIKDDDIFAEVKETQELKKEGEIKRY